MFDLAHNMVNSVFSAHGPLRQHAGLWLDAHAIKLCFYPTFNLGVITNQGKPKSIWLAGCHVHADGHRERNQAPHRGPATQQRP